MCGITGIYGFEDKGLVRKMTETLAHRGPDQHGCMFDKDVSFGHRRLSIIDLSEKGKQPMRNEDGTVWVVSNGEIYNFRELRKDLEKKHEFSSNTDTEVLIHAYEEYGIDFVSRLNGMFAFALWDSVKKRLILARDRIGIKPLYYYVSGGGEIAFASEIKALLRHAKLSLDKKAVYRFLALSYTPGEETVIEGVKRVMAGHMLVADKDGISVRKYWDATHPPREDRGLAFYAKALEKMLAKSVGMRLMSDVPLGVFLSGGLDSSVVAGLMKRFSDNIKTFSVGFNEDEYSELRYARLVSDHVGTDHHEIIVDYDRFSKEFKKIAWHLDEPLSDPAAILTYFLSEKARKKVKVVLTGEGGDELFAGYPKYYHTGNLKWIRRYYRIPGPARNAAAIVPKLRKFHEPFKLAGSLPLSIDVMHARSLQLMSESGEMGFDLAADAKERLSPHSLGPDDTKRLQHIDIKNWLPEKLLMKIDKTTMAHGLEARVPFLDHGIAEFSLGVPTRHNISGNDGKLLVKKAFSSILPREVVERKKQGFIAPVGPWQKDLDAMYEELGGSGRSVGGLVSRRLSDGIMKSGDIHQKFILLSLKAWADAYGV